MTSFNGPMNKNHSRIRGFRIGRIVGGIAVNVMNDECFGGCEFIRTMWINPYLKWVVVAVAGIKHDFDR